MGTLRPYKVVEDKYESQESYTIDIDLPDKGRFSYMNLLVKANSITEGTGGGPFIRTLISNVNINEGGSSHLNGAPPEAFQADFWYKTGQPWREGRHKWQTALDEVISQIPIMFGESIADPKYGIDLAKMSDPTLSITYDTGATRNTAVAPFESDYYPRFTPIIYLQEGVWPALEGYQSLRQIDRYTPANSEEHKTELKGGRPIKRVYAQYDKSTPYYEWGHSLTKGMLWADNKKYKPFEFKTFNWMQVIRDCYGLMTFPCDFYYQKGNSKIDTVVGSPISVEGHVWQSEYTMDPAIGSGREWQAIFRQISDGGNVDAEVLPVSWYATGYLPWDFLVIEAEKMLGMEWLDPTDKAPMYLELDHVSNAATIAGEVNVHICDKAVQY